MPPLMLHADPDPCPSYFRKSEKFTPNPLYPGVNVEDRGDSGLWRIGFSHFAAIGHYFLRACVEVGIPMIPCVFPSVLTTTTSH